MARKADALRPLGLTVAQYAALLTVGTAPDASATDVARACLVSPQSMAVTVGVLERRGLVVREDGPARGRARGAALTPAGSALLDDADRAAVAVERDVAGRLAAAEAATLRALLEPRPGDAFAMSVLDPDDPYRDAGVGPALESVAPDPGAAFFPPPGRPLRAARDPAAPRHARGATRPPHPVLVPVSAYTGRSNGEASSGWGMGRS